MPTYQYRCTDCGRDLEVVQKFTEPALTDCPACAGQLRKVFNAVGVVFKGSGFYRTDSRTGGSGGSGDAAKDAPKCSNKDAPKSSNGSSKEPVSASSGSSSTGSPPSST